MKIQKLTRKEGFMKKTVLLFFLFLFAADSEVFAMRQWHLEESYQGGIPDWLASIGAIVFIFWVGSICYEKFPKIAPLIGTCLFAFLTYRASQQYFCNYFMVLGMGIFTLFSGSAVYTDFFGESSQKQSNK